MHIMIQLDQGHKHYTPRAKNDKAEGDEHREVLEAPQGWRDEGGVLGQPCLPAEECGEEEHREDEGDEEGGGAEAVRCAKGQ